MASTFICGALSMGLAGAAAAQDAQPAAPQAVQEVVVTGTRLRSPNLTSLSPVTAVAADDFKAAGVADTADLLNQLPQVAVGTGFNNTPNPLSDTGGITTINLRNLGPARTLVLVDGKRLMPGDPTLGGNAPDIDQIPEALISRVDVVTGGASAVYGSDAIAGVVNFIMKHNFQGVQVDAQYGANEHDNSNSNMQSLEKKFGANAPNGSLVDGRNFTSTLTFGSNTPDDKGNVTGYVSYRHADPVLQGSRDYSACQLSQSSAAPHCTGSSNSNLFADGSLTGSVAGVFPNNIFATGAARNQSLTPPAAFNSNPYEYLSRGDERYTGGYFAHYQVTPNVDVYSDFSFMDDRTQIHAAPSALFQQTFNVNCNNPLLSAQQVSLIPECIAGGPTATAALTIGRRDVEGGPRIYDYEHESYKIDVGARGDFAEVWHYDVYAQFGRTQYNYSVNNDISLTKAQNALLIGTNGQCLSGTADGCVPYNIFSAGGVTPAALQYILTSGTTTGDTQEQIVSANVSGNLDKWGVKSPWANNGVAVSVGTEFRREQLDQVPDETSLSGDLAGAGGALPPVHGAFDVKELFGELGVPLVQGKRFVDDLSVEAGYRYSSYSISGDVTSWKLGLNYSPDPQIRFRGGYNRAVRAPNVNELFTPNQITNGTVVNDDPCSAVKNDGTTTRQAPATLAQCERTGVTAAQYGNGISSTLPGGTNNILNCPAGQCGVVDGGNLKLRPEISNTYTGGVVITPRFIRNFNLSIDYFNIDVDDAISTLPANITLSNCLTLGQDCNLIVRKSNGTLYGSAIATGGYISTTNLNVGHIQTEGVDFTANYRVNLDDVGLHDKGALVFRFDGTWTSHLTFEPIPGGGTYNCAGFYGSACQGQLTSPTWRHQLTMTYQMPWNISFMNRWRFIGGSKYAGNEVNPLLNVGAIDVNDARIPDVSYWDMSVTWKAKPGLTLRAGVNNLLDRDPPLIDANVAGSGLPNTLNSYDELGRQLFVGLTADF